MKFGHADNFSRHHVVVIKAFVPGAHDNLPAIGTEPRSEDRKLVKEDALYLGIVFSINLKTNEATSKLPNKGANKRLGRAAMIR